MGEGVYGNLTSTAEGASFQTRIYTKNGGQVGEYGLGANFRGGGNLITTAEGANFMG
jgi:hypothetical protein